MRLYDHTNQEWIAHFLHDQHFIVRGGKRRRHPTIPPATLCTLHRAPCIVNGSKPCDTIKEVFIGAAVCSLKDQFQKAIGRKIALARAMKHGSLDLQTRTGLWESYTGIKVTRSRRMRREM